jgi:hypothetical protein
MSPNLGAECAPLRTCGAGPRQYVATVDQCRSLEGQVTAATRVWRAASRARHRNAKLVRRLLGEKQRLSKLHDAGCPSHA